MASTSLSWAIHRCQERGQGCTGGAMGLFTFGRIRSITRAPDRRQELEYFGAYGSQQKKFWNPPDDGLRNGNPFPSHLKQLSAKSREAARFSCVNLLVTDLAPNCHPDRDNTQQSYPDLDDTSALSSPRRCNSLSEPIPGCKTFHVPKDDASKETEVSVTEDPDPNPDAEPDASDTGSTLDLTDQVLVFRYRGKFHAVYHVSSLHGYRDRGKR